MSTVWASATSTGIGPRALFLLAALGAACGGRAIEDEGSGGSAPGLGGMGTDGTGSLSSATGGSLSTGGTGATGGLGGEDADCNLTTIECTSGFSCACPGVFEGCSHTSIHCERDANGDPTNCVCGEPEIGVDECDYAIQYRCDPPEAIGWLKTCTCDPALPTDEEPCRYHQQMYDSLGEDRTCSMVIADTEPSEKYKYYCSCIPSE